MFHFRVNGALIFSFKSLYGFDFLLKQVMCIGFASRSAGDADFAALGVKTSLILMQHRDALRRVETQTDENRIVLPIYKNRR